MLFISVAPAFAIQNGVGIYLNGEKQDCQGIVENQRTMLHIREMCKIFDMRIDYHYPTGKITVYVDKDNVYGFTIGSKAVTLNGKPVQALDTAPFLYNNRTYLPVRYIGELVGAGVNWNSKKFSVEFTLDELVIENGVLKKYNGHSKTLDLSKRTDIVAIGSEAFCRAEVTEVKLPPTLKKIGFGAFQYSNLERISIPDNVSEIEALAFDSCFNLKEIRLPDELKSLSEQVLCHTKVKELVVPVKVESIGGAYLFSMGVSTTGATTNSIESIILPPSVTYINDNSFFACDKLVIQGLVGSYAESYAKAHNISFKAISEAELAQKITNR